MLAALTDYPQMTWQVTKKPTRRDEIFDILVDYAKAHKGNSPTQRGLWREVMRARGQSMAYGVFMRHMDTLVREQRVLRIDGELVIPDSEWILLS